MPAGFSSSRVGVSMLRRMQWFLLVGWCGWASVGAAGPVPPAAPVSRATSWWAKPMAVPACARLSYRTIYRPDKLLRPTFQVMVKRPETADAATASGQVLVYLSLQSHREPKEAYRCVLKGQASPNRKEIVLEANQPCELEELWERDFCALAADRCAARLEGLSCQQEEAGHHLGPANAWLKNTKNRLWQGTSGQVHLELNALVRGCVLANYPPQAPLKVTDGSVRVGPCEVLEGQGTDEKAAAEATVRESRPAAGAKEVGDESKNK